MKNLIAAVVLVLVVSGCNLPRRQLAPEVRAQLGRVDVVNRSQPHAPNPGNPPTTWSGGLGLGLARGLVLIPAAAVAGAAGGGSGGGIGALFGGAAGAAFGIFWLPFSILGGAVTPASLEEVRNVHKSVETVWNESSPSDYVCRGLEIASRARPSVKDIPVKAAKPTPTFDAVLESEVTVEFRGGGIFGNLWSVNPDLNLAVVLRTKLIRSRDGEVIDRRTIEVQDPKARSLGEWGAPGTFRTSLHRSLQSVVAQAGYELFNFGPAPLAAGK